MPSFLSGSTDESSQPRGLRARAPAPHDASAPDAYARAGVDLAARNEYVEQLKKLTASDNPNVLSGVGGFGAMYRLGNSVGLLGQYQVNDQFRIGYAFDLTTTEMSAYNAGTHEIMLSYDLRFVKGRTISPRYF